MSSTTAMSVGRNPNSPVSLNGIPNTPRKPLRKLPEKVLIGYTTTCDDRVKQAVRLGVNVVIWAFCSISKQDDGETVARFPMDKKCVKQLIDELDEEGFDDTVHLVSFGGWNGPHLDTRLTAEEWYETWKKFGGTIFHGLDWDPEGHDSLESPTNFFTMECLDQIGRVSRLAKEDGYIVTIAPAQSYLDIQSSKFSRYVNLTESDRPWHSEFHYFGANVYAFILAKYGNYIDLISIQFYESFSRAAMAIQYDNMSPDSYLEYYIQELVQRGESYFVDFGEDANIGLQSQDVSIPLSKLVFGFGNGWCLESNPSDKCIYMRPHDIGLSYKRLVQKEQVPRGFMFWVIDEEKSREFQFVKGLNQVLHIREPIEDEASEL